MIVDFKFDVHKNAPEVGLVEKLTRSLYWLVELCVPTLHRVCYTLATPTVKVPFSHFCSWYSVITVLQEEEK